MIPVLAAVPVVVLDLAVDDGGLVEGGQTGQWEWGRPSGGGPVVDGAWATVIDGPYLNDAVDWLALPVGDVSSLSRPVLELHHWYAIDAGDGGRLEIDGQLREPLGGYPTATGFSGVSGGFVDSYWDLSGFGPSPSARLVFRADDAVADDGWYLTRVRLLDGDPWPPTVVPAVQPTDTQDLDGPYTIELDVTDDATVAAVAVSWSTDGGSEREVAAIPVGGTRWRAELPGRAPDTVVSWRATADDGENVSGWPAEGTASFRVFLAPPTDLVADLPKRQVAQRLALSWTAPDSPHPVVGYDVFQSIRSEPVASTTSPSAELVPDPLLPTTFTVRARFAVGDDELPGDPSLPLELDLEVPTLLSVDPSTLWQGGEARITVSGASLYLTRTTTSFSLGEGVGIDEVDIQDADTVVLVARVSPEAEVGPRALVVDGVFGEWRFEDAVTIGDDLDAPRVRRVEPAALDQGQEVAMELEATVVFGQGYGTLEVTTDDELVVTSDAWIDGNQVRFGLAASTRASVGPHTLLLDDGRRLFATEIFVEEVTAPLEPGCGGCDAAGSGGSPVLWLSALGTWRRRRSGPAARAR